MQHIYAFFKSVRLAVVLLIVIAVASIVSTLIPQGREAAFYYAKYPELFGALVIALQFDRFFSSFLFIATISLFTANLSVCAIDRIVRELTNRRKKRFGPDMIHIGLLVLIVGGVFTFVGRREAFFYMAVGDEVSLPGEYVLRLESYDFYVYEDGRPKDWVSTVDVFSASELYIDDYSIEVNKPLSIGKFDVFQSSYGERVRVEILESNGSSFLLDAGSYFRIGNDIFLFTGVLGSRATTGGYIAQFEQWEDQERKAAFNVRTGDPFGNVTLGSIEVAEVTGLQVVADPGYLPALIGFILCVLGLSLTYIQKIGDKEI